jgi:hypothetical protein
MSLDWLLKLPSGVALAQLSYSDTIRNHRVSALMQAHLLPQDGLTFNFLSQTE